MSNLNRRQQKNTQRHQRPSEVFPKTRGVITTTSKTYDNFATSPSTSTMGIGPRVLEPFTENTIDIEETAASSRDLEVCYYTVIKYLLYKFNLFSLFEKKVKYYFLK